MNAEGDDDPELRKVMNKLLKLIHKISNAGRNVAIIRTRPAVGMLLTHFKHSI